MHGWIHNFLEKMVIELHGADVCTTVKNDSNWSHIPTGGWVLLQNYDDGLTFGFVTSASSILGEDTNSFLERLGSYFLHLLRTSGYAYLLACQGNTLISFLENVNDIHNHLKAKMAETFVFPTIHCGDDPENAPGCFLLCYRSPKETLLAPLLVGLVKAAAEFYFNRTVDFKLLWEQGEDNKFTTWRVRDTSHAPSICESHSARIIESSRVSRVGPGSAEENITAGARRSPPRCPFSGASCPGIPLSFLIISKGSSESSGEEHDEGSSAGKCII